VFLASDADEQWLVDLPPRPLTDAAGAEGDVFAGEDTIRSALSVGFEIRTAGLFDRGYRAFPCGRASECEIAISRPARVG
jgi:hypothetical protein